MLHSLVVDVARTEGCDPEILSSLVLESVCSAARETWPGAGGRFEASWGPDDAVELRLYRTVGDDLSLDDARRCGLDDPADPLQLGDELGLTVFYRAEQREERERQAAAYGPVLQLEQPEGGFGRRASTAAHRALREALRARTAAGVRDVFEPLVGRLVVGRARRHERGALVVDVGGVEARLSMGAGGEGVRPGARVVALVEAVRGDTVVLTRAGDAFLRALVALEVPEVEAGEIELVAVAREATRAKIAVRMAGDETGETSLDAVERVVGMRGERVLAVVAALGDLQLDVVPWHPDPVRAAIEALSGVEVVEVASWNDVLEVRVAREEVRAAVGQRGANARLAAKLAGWRDVVVAAVDEARGARGEDERSDESEVSAVIHLSEEGAKRYDELVEMEHETKLGSERPRFDMAAAMARGWDEASESYRAAGVDPEDVLARAASVVEALRGVPASVEPPEDGEI